MRQKNLVIGLLVMLALVVSGFTYAFWAGTITDGVNDIPGSVQIGEGEPVTIQVAIGAQGGDTEVLVPTTVTPLEGQSNSIEISFIVTWTNDPALTGIADADVSVLIENIEVDGVENPYTLISVVEKSGNPETIALGAQVTFYFVITMSEPSNQEQYTAVAGKEITFDLTFSIDQQVE
jgi:hypothetical protein